MASEKKLYPGGGARCCCSVRAGPESRGSAGNLGRQEGRARVGGRERGGQRREALCFLSFSISFSF